MSCRPSALAVLSFVYAACLAGPAAALPPGWVKEVISSSFQATFPREVRATILDDRPSVFFYDHLPAGGEAGPKVLRLSQRRPDGTWDVRTVLSRQGESLPHWMDYAEVGGVPWLAVAGSERLELFSRDAAGAWVLRHERTGGRQYGDGVSMADFRGRPVLTYAGTDTNFYSGRVMFLEQTAAGAWNEEQLSTPRFSITERDIRSFGDRVGILASYENQGLRYFEREGDGPWVASDPSAERLGQGVFAGDINRPSYFTAERRSYRPVGPSRIYTRDAAGAWTSTIVNGLSFPVGEDYEIIDGVPTVAYFERGDGTVGEMALHLARHVDGRWEDVVLEGGWTSYDREVSLLSVDGLPAVAAFNQTTGEVAYFRAVPEPGAAVITLCALCAAALGRRRRRIRELAR